MLRVISLCVRMVLLFPLITHIKAPAALLRCWVHKKYMDANKRTKITIGSVGILKNKQVNKKTKWIVKKQQKGLLKTGRMIYHIEPERWRGQDISDSFSLCAERVSVTLQEAELGAARWCCGEQAEG